MSYEAQYLAIDSSKDWYYTTGHNDGDDKRYTVIVFAKTRKEAKIKATQWAYLNKIKYVGCFRNRRKIEARLLIIKGEFIL